VATSDAIDSKDAVRAGRLLSVRARLLLAFFGISTYSPLAALWRRSIAFRQVGEQLDLIDANVPQVVSECPSVSGFWE
jgi:hypothetical protein